MKRTIAGQKYHVVPSRKCHSLIGGIRCAMHDNNIDCNTLSCTQPERICFLTDTDFTKWLKTRLTT